MFDITSITSYPAANKQFTTHTGSLRVINSRTSNEVDCQIDCPLLEFELVCGKLRCAVSLELPAWLAALEL